MGGTLSAVNIPRTESLAREISSSSSDAFISPGIVSGRSHPHHSPASYYRESHSSSNRHSVSYPRRKRLIETVGKSGPMDRRCPPRASSQSSSSFHMSSRVDPTPPLPPCSTAQRTTTISIGKGPVESASPTTLSTTTSSNTYSSHPASSSNRPQPYPSSSSTVPPQGLKGSLSCRFAASRRRKWGLPSSSRLLPKRPQYVYYLRPPGGYILEMLVCMDNVAQASQQQTTEPASQENQKDSTNGRSEKEDTPPSSASSPTFYSAPVVLHRLPVSATTDGRGSLKIPLKYFLGRTYQVLDGVPVEARRWFSRRHCTVEWKYDGLRLGEASFYLHDLNSANGTYLNNVALAHGGQEALQDGDIIGVSMTEQGQLMMGFRFTVDAIAAYVKGFEPRAWNALSGKTRPCGLPATIRLPTERIVASASDVCTCLECLFERGEPFLSKNEEEPNDDRRWYYDNCPTSPHFLSPPPLHTTTASPPSRNTPPSPMSISTATNSPSGRRGASTPQGGKTWAAVVAAQCSPPPHPQSVRFYS